MTSLGAALDALYAELAAQGATVRRKPGMEREAVIAALESQGLPPHPAVVDFFAWSEEAWADVFLCPIGMERATIARDSFRLEAPYSGGGNGPMANLFPLLSGNGDVHIAVDTLTGELYYVDIECGRCDLFAPSALVAVQALNAGLLSGALAYDPDERRDVVEVHPRWGSIRDDHGVRSIGWG